MIQMNLQNGNRLIDLENELMFGRGIEVKDEGKG